MKLVPQTNKKNTIVVATPEMIQNMRIVDGSIELLHMIHKDDTQTFNMIKRDILKFANGIKNLKHYESYKNLPTNIKRKLSK